MKAGRSKSLVFAAILLGAVVCACGPFSGPVPTEPPVIAPTQAPPTAEPTPTPTEAPAEPSLGDAQTRPTDGMMMVFVPGGTFPMGSTEDQLEDALALCNEHLGDCSRSMVEGELPAHDVLLDSFWIDRTEVTNGQYAQCVAAGACDPPEQTGSNTRETYYGDVAYDDYPVVWVSWDQATAYCEWAGARLPTEAEWEYAARGPVGSIFAWGNAFDGESLNYCDANCGFPWADAAVDDGYADTAPVGSYPAGASWCGALDMGGNVWEWVADWYGEYPSEPQVNPSGSSVGDSRALRGGSWDANPSGCRCTERRRYYPYGNSHNLGIRCASSASESE